MIPTNSMTLAQAAQIVLSQAAEPLHVDILTTRVLDQDLWRTSGKTPSASMYSMLHRSISILRAASPFMQTAPATFALRPVQGIVTPAVTE